jgi:phosphatidylserine/phosphatidylglycerophosphate/cardiolipin synthase-like enzyme
MEYDTAESLRHAVPEPPNDAGADATARPDVLIRTGGAALLAAEAAEDVTDVSPPTFFLPESITLGTEDSVLPLLTQDNYIEEVLRLIEGARTSLRLQFQYIRLRRSPAPPPRHRELIHLLKRKIDELETVEVIVGLGDDTRKDLENLLGIELDIDKFRVQTKVHNKAILVDGKAVVAGSQNWSGDGTVRNRDASLLIRSRAAHDYYARIFRHDWERLAARSLRRAPLLDLADSPTTPPGFERLSWRDVFDA